jgi:hypothetical protein
MSPEKPAAPGEKKIAVTGHILRKVDGGFAEEVRQTTKCGSLPVNRGRMPARMAVCFGAVTAFFGGATSFFTEVSEAFDLIERRNAHPSSPLPKGLNKACPGLL